MTDKHTDREAVGPRLDRGVGRRGPKRAEYAGVRCMCVLTGCRAGPGCPLYCGHCKAHIAFVSRPHDADKPDPPEATALANAQRRIRALEAALQGVLDPFHQGQITVRPEAAGYVQAAVDAGEEALKTPNVAIEPRR